MTIKENFILKNDCIISLILLVVITTIVYSNSLKNSFVFDDGLTITENYFIKSWKNLPRIFGREYLTSLEDRDSLGQRDIGSGESSYRPVVTLSFFADYFFWRLNPFGYHLTNLLFHIFNAILLFFFARLITKNNTFATLSSLLFAIHPINAEAVDVVSFREDLLAFFFYISSLILYISLSRLSRKKQILAYWLSLILFCLSLFSKEMSVTLPFVLILYDYIFVSQGNLKELIGKFKYRYLGYGLICLFYLITWVFLIGNKNPKVGYPGGNFYTNILTMSVVVATYIKWLFIPFGVHFILPSPSMAHTWLSPIVSVSSLLIITSIVVATINLRKSKLISFSILWFFITLLPVYNIFPLVSPMALRYLYTPILGFCLLLSFLLLRLPAVEVPWFTTKTLKRFVQFIIAIILVLYSVLTIINHDVWKDDAAMWSEIIKRYSRSALAHMSLGNAYYKKGLYNQAIEEYKVAQRLNSRDAKIHNALGYCYDDIGRKNEAIAEFKNAIDLNPNYANAYNNLCNTLISVRKDAQAIEFCKKAIQLNSSMARSYYNLGNAYTNLGRTEDAIEANKKAIEANPNYVEAYNNLAAEYAEIGEVDKAIKLWNKAVQLKPDFAVGHFNLAVFYFQQGKYDLAIRHCDKVIELGSSVDPKFLELLKPYRK